MNFEMPNQNSKEEKHKKGKEDKEYGSSSPVFPEGELDAMIEGLEGTPLRESKKKGKEKVPEKIEEFSVGQKIKVGREVYEITGIDKEREIISWKKVGGFSKKEEEKGWTKTGNITLKALREKLEKYSFWKEKSVKEAKLQTKENLEITQEKEEEIESKEKEKEGEKLQKEKSISPEGEEKKVEQTKRPDFLSYSRELTKEQKLELSEETLERWQSYLKEEQYKLLVKYAQDFCEKRGLVSGERPNAPDFYLKIFRENGDIEALDDSQKEALRRVETLIKLVETRGKDISIAERFLLIRAAEDKIDILERDMKGLDKESPEFLSKKAEISKIRDLQADILSETYKDKEGNETFKTDTYKEAYERLREEYQGKGMLELYETLMEEARGETLEGKKIRGEGLKLKLSQERWQKAKEEFLKRRDELYDEILGKKIKEIIGNFESAQGGIENWYSKIKDGLIEDLMKKKENGELNIENLDIDKDNPPKNEEEAKEQVIRAAEKISGENIPEESKEKFWKRWGKKIWEKGKGPLGTICLLIIAALIGIIAIEFGIAGYLFTKIEKGKR
jgi:hypothetical protein